MDEFELALNVASIQVQICSQHSYSTAEFNVSNTVTNTRLLRFNSFDFSFIKTGNLCFCTNLLCRSYML